MTLQEIFDKSVGGVLQQGGPSISRSGGFLCLYRSPNGRRCAAGWLITDTVYKEDLESMTSHTPEVRRALIDSGVTTSEGLALVEWLQNAHDRAAEEEESNFLPEFRRMALNVAKRINLNTTILENECE